MKIPKKLKVGGVVYNVTLVDRLSGTSVGEQNPMTHELIICDNSNKEETFMHEMVHAILGFMGKQEHDEEFVEAFAQALYAVVIDNKEVFEHSEEE